MITKEKVLKVVASLKTVEERANREDGFDMSEGQVDFDNKGHPCGTTHCLAGLYVVANYKRPFIINARAKASVKKKFGYSDGAELMANDLGFETASELKYWLKKHPEEWGNSGGDYIFMSECSFNYEGFSGVIEHFEEFAGRLK